MRVIAILMLLTGCGAGATIGSVVGGTVGAAVDIVTRDKTPPLADETLEDL